MDLLRTLRHTVGGKKVLKNMVDQFMGFQPVIVGIHPIISSFPVMLCFRFHRICSARPGGKGNNTDKVRQDLHGRISGISTAFNPGAAQPLHAGQCIVSHYLPGQRLCGRRCQRRPRAGKIARRGKLQGFPRVVAHTARIALLSGWLSVLLVCNFQGTARGDSEPLTVLPKIAFGEYPYFEEFSKKLFGDPAGCGLSA